MLTCLYMKKTIFYKLQNAKCPISNYLDSLSDKQVEKIFFVLDLFENIDIVPHKFFKKLLGTDGIWEVRVQYENNIFRLLGFFDGSDLIVLNHAFTKKTQKTPKREIKIAEQRKKDYFLTRILV
jgi:phage-related protein